MIRDVLNFSIRPDLSSVLLMRTQQPISGQNLKLRDSFDAVISVVISSK